MFDPQTVADVGTYEKPNQKVAEMQTVLDKGGGVVSNGALVKDAAPGQPIRRKVK